MRKRVVLQLLGKKKLVSATLHEKVIETWREVADFLGVPMAEILETGLAKVFADVDSGVSGLLENGVVSNEL